MKSKKKNSTEVNKKLREKYIELGVANNRCEIVLTGCLLTWPLAFAHRHRRWWYTKKQEMLSEYNQTIIACQFCHDKIDCNQKLLEEVFNRLRGKEII